MSLARTVEIARVELRAKARSPLFWVLLLLVLLMTASLNNLVPSGDDAVGGAKPFTNSVYALAQIFVMIGFLVYGFFCIVIAGMAALEDDEVGVSDLLHATPLTVRELVWGKFAGLLAAFGAVLLAQLVFVLWLHQLSPIDRPELRGAFELSSFLIPALALTAPLIVFCAGIGFAAGSATRRPILVFVLAIVFLFLSLFFFWTWTPVWLDPRIDRLLRIVDPSAIRWLTRTFFTVDRGVAFYNTSPLLLDATFWLNRLWTLAVPLLALLFSVRACRRRILGLAAGRPARRAASEPPRLPSWRTAGRLKELEMRVSEPGFFSSVWQMARVELREIRSQPALYVLIPFVMLMVWEVATSTVAALDAPVLLTAGGLATQSIEMLTLFLCLLLLFYTVESVSRDTITGFDALLYASPVKTGALLLAKSLASYAVVATVLLACTLAGVGLILLQGEGRLELWPFVLVWGLVLLPTFLLWNAFVTAVLALVGGRHLTYAIGLAALVLNLFHHMHESMSWLYNWNLWGALRWSDLGTFELDREALFLNRLLMTGLAMLCAAVAVRAFARSDRDAIATLAALRPARLLGHGRRLAPLALLPLVAGVLLASKIDSGFQSAAATEAEKEYRRQNVATWSDREPPSLLHVDLEIDLEPAARRMEVVGGFTMVNRGEEAMPRLPFTAGSSFEDVAWTVDGSAVEVEDRSGLHLLTPLRPLQPGEEVRVGFSYAAVVPRGATRNGGGTDQFILPSGVVLHSLTPGFIPLPGFFESIGVDPESRPEPAEIAVDSGHRELKPVIGSAFTTRVVVSAPSEYTVNGVGVKTAETAADGRTTVVWESDHPVKALNLVAGRWQVRRQGSNAVFYHPGHPYNVDEILQALVAARARYSEWFHPYPWQELRISEFPDLMSRAQGFATNIPFSEGIGFLTRSGEGDLAFVVTAHEVAHQWWGNLLTPGEAPGADLLIEGMAHYSTLLLQESERGLRGRIEFAWRLERLYTEQRRVDAERPLAEIRDLSHPADETVVYNKGAWVLWMLHDHLGREAMLAGLQAFIARHLERDDAPAVADLIETLRPHAADPAAFQAFVDQWFHDVVLPEFRIDEPTLERTASGYEVAATFRNRGTASATVEIAAARGRRFSDPAADDPYRDSRRTLTLAPGERRKVTWTVDFEPERLVVDPDLRVLQLNRSRATVSLPGV